MDPAGTEGSLHSDELPSGKASAGGGTDSSSSVVPPYWQHRRFESYASVTDKKPPPITLEDHTEESSEQSGSLWAKGVSVEDHVVVSGNVPSLGDYVVWNCQIATLDVGFHFLRSFFYSLTLVLRAMSSCLSLDECSGWINDYQKKVDLPPSS